MQYLSIADMDTFIRPLVLVRFRCVISLSWERPYGKHLQRISDNCSGEGIT